MRAAVLLGGGALFAYELSDRLCLSVHALVRTVEHTLADSQCFVCVVRVCSVCKECALTLHGARGVPTFAENEHAAESLFGYHDQMLVSKL
jgi:hypothetical protein